MSPPHCAGDGRLTPSRDPVPHHDLLVVPGAAPVCSSSDGAIVNDRPDTELRPSSKRAAAYVRMSTEQQQYSTDNQSKVIRQYADRHGYRIVRTYADEGRSGLTIAGRPGLQRLIADVEAGEAEFTVILVYDVSRWGRFQEPDEGAYYEFLCKRAGIRVSFCAEPFENIGSSHADLLKAVKRMMAGEYSRELSVKVFAGQCRLIELGYRQGGPAGFGLRRMMVDQTGARKGLIPRGAGKHFHTDRVILVPGPPEEVETVRGIYRAFVEQTRTETQIAAALNARGIRTDRGRAWTRGTVRQVLTNEKYIGNNVYNRTSAKLRQRRVANPPKMWVRADGVFKRIVAPDLFHAAQARIAARHRRFTDEEMIECLAGLSRTRGTLSRLIIDETEEMPSSGTYRRRFGSVVRAYRLAGYTPERDYRYLEVNRRLRARHPELVAEILVHVEDLGGAVEVAADSGWLWINQEFTVALVLSRCHETAAGSLRWTVRLEPKPSPDITLAVRMARGNERPLDYYLLPALDRIRPHLQLAEENGAALDIFRFDSLDVLYGLGRRVRLTEVA